MPVVYIVDEVPQSKPLAFAQRGDGCNRRMSWSDIDRARRIWPLHVISAKAGRGHGMPLTDVAMDLVSSMPVFEGDYVFTIGDIQTPVS